MSALHHRDIVAARKQHKCSWCGDTIEIGTSYRSWVWSEDGDFTRIACHPECKVAWEELEQLDPLCLFAGALFSRGCMCDHNNCTCDPAPTFALIAQE